MSEFVVTVGRVASPEARDWAAVFATRDFGALTDWYVANSGHDPAADYETVDGTLAVNAAWLSANNGNGRVGQEAGRWYVERYRVTGTLRVAADNITFSNIHLDSTGALYSFQSREADGNAHGIVLEHSTIAGNGANDNGASLNFPVARDPGQIVLRHCDVSGYRAGLYAFGGITAEYCYVHDLHYSPESHNTGASIRAGNVVLRRNLIVDGNSAAVSMYPEYGPYTGVLVEQNALRLPEADTGPELLLAQGRAFSEPAPGDTRRVLGNLFYRGGNGGRGGGIGGYRTGLTEVAGNFDIEGAPVN